MASDGDGWRLLLAAVLAQAGRDARRGDALARQWLATDGRELLDDLDLAVDIGGWLADLPDVAQPCLALAGQTI